MDNASIITSALGHGFQAEERDGVVFVAASGLGAITWRHDMIEAGAEYLGAQAAPAMPLGFPVSRHTVLRCFRGRSAK